MAIVPKVFKFKKYFKGKIRTTTKNKTLNFGNFGLKATEAGRLTPKQIETVRRTIKKVIKPVGGLVRTKVRAYTPVTSKAIATRMGRGKGKVSIYVSAVPAGTVLFEIFCSDKFLAMEAARQGAFRLPIKSAIITRA
jgi:large subunit ribosomal protein L16